MQWGHQCRLVQARHQVQAFQTAVGGSYANDLSKLQEMTVAKLVALSWEFAKQRATEQCTVVGKEAIAARNIYSKALSQLSWSLASSRTQDRALITDLASAIGSHASSFQVRDLAMATWALARLSADDSCAWRELQFQASKKLNACSHQDLSNLLWAFAKSLNADSGFFAAAIDHISRASYLAQFSSQGITNLSWAFAIATLPTGLQETLQETRKRGLSEFTAKAISILAWCCATALQSSIPPLVRQTLLAIEATALQRMHEFSAQGLANLSWAFASTTTFSAPFAHALGVQVLKRETFPLQEASNTCWAFAAAQHVDAAVLMALSTRLQGLLQLPQRKALQRAEMEACASVWAFNAATVADAELASCVKSRVLSIGQALDESSGLRPLLRANEEKQLESDVSRPEIILDLADRLVLRKPSGWDIQRSRQDSNLNDVKAVPTVADFLSSRLGAKTTPIFCDKGHQSGMIHRLDVPNSGLLLVAKSYRAYYDLMFQMNTGMVRRDYIVLCHGWVPRSCLEIAAPLHWGQNIAPSMIRQHGKPARTFLQVLAHLVRQPEGDCYSLVEISIETGRRHQIRSHLAFIGHPLVGDAKYSSAATFQVDHILSNRNFLHRVRLSFFDRDGRTVEAADTLPPDLSLALSTLEAKDDESEHWKLLWSR